MKKLIFTCAALFSVAVYSYAYMPYFWQKIEDPQAEMMAEIGRQAAGDTSTYIYVSLNEVELVNNIDTSNVIEYNDFGDLLDKPRVMPKALTIGLMPFIYVQGAVDTTYLNTLNSCEYWDENLEVDSTHVWEKMDTIEWNPSDAYYTIIPDTIAHKYYFHVSMYIEHYGTYVENMFLPDSAIYYQGDTVGIVKDFMYNDGSKMVNAYEQIKELAGNNKLYLYKMMPDFDPDEVYGKKVTPTPTQINGVEVETEQPLKIMVKDAVGKYHIYIQKSGKFYDMSGVEVNL